WRQALASSHWVARPDAGDAESPAEAPLVLEHGLLYLRRYREYERRLAAGLRRIGNNSAPVAPLPPPAGEDARRADGGPPAPPAGDEAAQVPTPLANLFAQLFPQAATGGDLQAQAAAAALHHNLLLVTGGPGTGKTTTITRMLVLLVAQALQAGAAPPRIALASATGRAAERMAESVRNAVQALAESCIDTALSPLLPATDHGDTSSVSPTCRRWTNPTSTPPCQPYCQPPSPPCTPSTAPSPTAPPPATTPTTRSRSTSWWWTKPP